MIDENLTVEERLIKKQVKKIEGQDKKIHSLQETVDSQLKTQLKEKKKDQKTISNQTKVILDLQKELADVKNVTSNFDIEAPYVHCKINIVKGGRSPKTEMSLSAGGAIDQLSFPDVEAHTEKLIMIIKKEIDDAMDKLTTEE